MLAIPGGSPPRDLYDDALEHTSARRHRVKYERDLSAHCKVPEVLSRLVKEEFLVEVQTIAAV